ncbi:hypothetical protein H6F61_20520 [Cyanobacteria bacterium FACHB-472]|nr:hypothetical protein [Cyanobacteria bacterium FACHB-472]
MRSLLILSKLIECDRTKRIRGAIAFMTPATRRSRHGGFLDLEGLDFNKVDVSFFVNRKRLLAYFLIAIYR